MIWEVFRQEREGQPFTHGGSLEAPNREFAEAFVESDAAPALEALAWDPQTSGGLLVSVPAERAVVLQATFEREGVFAARLGRVEQGAGVAFAA